MKHLSGRTVASNPDAPLAGLVDASADFIWILGLDGGVACMNSAAQQLFGNQGADSWTNGWPEESRFTTERALATALGGGRSKFRLRRPDAEGDPRYLDITVSPMRDPHGEISQLFAVAVDVTSQIESRAFLSTVVDALPQALTVYDLRSKRVVLANHSAEALWATLHAEGAPAEGPNVFEWSADNDAAVADARRITRTDIVETPAGPRRFSTLKIATYDDSGARHLISLTEDVTDDHADREATHQALHAAEAADQAKSAFLANMNHEIRTPLNGVVAGLDVLRARLKDEENRDLADVVWNSATTLTARIDALFAARSVAVEPALCNEKIVLTALLDELIQPFVETAKAKTIDLTLAAPLNIPSDIVGDRNCLLSALRPLVDNAVKFTDTGKITIRLDHFQDGCLRFSVLDTGVGFDADAKDQIFVPFGRQDQSLTRRFGGLGLGLASARTFAARMGGSIDAKPRAEGGSIFWMDLPLPSAGASPQNEPSTEEREPERLRLLVADDHPTNRRVLELILGDLADITAVENGQEAVEATQATRFDVILMDIQMPVMDGITAVAAIREREQARGQEPAAIIMLTANTEDEYVRASHAAGADRHIAKPFTAAVLLEAIHGVRTYARPSVSSAVEIDERRRHAS